MWTCSSVIVIITLLPCLGASAQLVPKRTFEPVPVPDPAQLLEQLMPVTKDCGDCDSKERDDAQAAALSALGIPAKFAHEARLVFEDLDGDGVAEALFTVDVDGVDVFLVVLKRKGNQWYRLLSPPGLSCWDKYEMSSLNTFVELRDWSYSFEKTSQPRRLIFVSGSSGGSGLYERQVEVFALQGSELRSVFSQTDEVRECEPGSNCDLKHVIITIEAEYRRPRALVTHEIRRTVNPDKLGSEESWWVGLPIAPCKADRKS